jgi:hypothetical protein
LVEFRSSKESDGSGEARLKILVSLVRFQFWPNFFPEKIGPERRPIIWPPSGIEAKTDVFAAAKTGYRRLSGQDARWRALPERIPVPLYSFIGI